MLLSGFPDALAGGDHPKYRWCGVTQSISSFGAPFNRTQLYTPEIRVKEVLQDCTEGYAVGACSGAAYPAVADMMSLP